MTRWAPGRAARSGRAAWWPRASSPRPWPSRRHGPGGAAPHRSAERRRGSYPTTSLCPVTFTSCPIRRRHASLTTANASGRISSSTSASSPCTSPRACRSRTLRFSRSCGSVATRFRARIDSISPSVSSVCLVMVALNSSVFPFRAPVESDSIPAQSSLISLTRGRRRLTSRTCLDPAIFLMIPLIILLFGTPGYRKASASSGFPVRPGSSAEFRTGR